MTAKNLTSRIRVFGMKLNFKNHTIWTGDNLPIMRGLNSECVDLIYLDPPFNSNRDYAAPIGSEAAGAAFKDTWTLDDVDRLWLLLLRDKDPVLYHVIEGARLVHGNGNGLLPVYDGPKVEGASSDTQADRFYLSSLRPHGQSLFEVAHGCRVRERGVSK